MLTITSAFSEQPTISEVLNVHSDEASTVELIEESIEIELVSLHSSSEVTAGGIVLLGEDRGSSTETGLANRLGFSLCFCWH